MSYEEAKKYLKKQNNKKSKPFVMPKFINKLLITVIIFLITIVILKSNSNYKQMFYQKIYTDNIKFASIHKLYEQYFGSPLPFNIFKDNTETVFNEELSYSGSNIYLNGVSLSVSKKYLVPSFDNGIVIFIGEKEGYNNTVIVECENGVEVWYGNIDTTNVKMYDYIKKGSLIGEVNDNLYLVFMKDGKYLNYEDYI